MMHRWFITTKKINKGSGTYFGKPFDTCSVYNLNVNGKDIFEALENAKKLMENDKWIKDYTICDVYNATFYPM